jgi:hypothetical protein
MTIVTVLSMEVDRLRRELLRYHSRLQWMRKERNRWRDMAIELNPDLGRVTRTRSPNTRHPREYATEAERVAARQRSWRESKRRARAA